MPSESTGAGQGCALKSSSLQKKNLKIETNYDLKKNVTDCMSKL
jgi:hypothetical protein